MYESLNLLLFAFHTGWIAFNMTGWMWRRTRPWHLLTLGLTGFSWFVLGIWYGWGYCLCTDWHWQVRRKLGYIDPPGTSYVQLLVKTLTGADVSRQVCDVAALTIFIVAVVLSVGMFVRDRRQ